jgi:hypothetical protein
VEDPACKRTALEIGDPVAQLERVEKDLMEFRKFACGVQAYLIHCLQVW